MLNLDKDNLNEYETKLVSDCTAQNFRQILKFMYL
jgi:hypothetical protein